MSKKLILTLLLLVVINFVGVYPSQAQSPVGRVIISDILTDGVTFPVMVVKGYFLDGKGVPVSTISQDMVSLKENNELVDFSMEQLSSGIRTALVLDMGKWINNPTGQNKRLTKKIMQEAADRFIDAMGPEDMVEIVVVYDKDPFIAQPYTSDKSILRETISNLDWENTQSSYGIEGIRTAGMSLVEAPNDLYKHIVFISPGIMQRGLDAENEKNIIQDLNVKNIPVFSLHIPGQESYGYYETISEETGGKFFQYESEKDLLPLFASLEKYRDQYRFTYRSKIGDVTERTVSLGYGTQGGASDTKVYSIDSAWIAPSDVEVIANNYEQIVISAENPTTPIPVFAILHGIGNRQIREVELLANGSDVGNLNQTGDDTFSTTWNASRESFSEGDNSLVLEVTAEDEFGEIHHGSSAVTINLEPPSDPLCRTLGLLPGIGTGIANACVDAGFNLATLLNIFFLILIVALGVLLWFKRDKVREISKVAGDRITQVVDKLTERYAKREPKARLIAIQGIPPENRQEFDIYGETPIGRSGEHALLIFEYEKVSRLHCTIHEDHAGVWTVEDHESANGTFINGKKLEPFEPKEFDHGMELELGPVEYGGIKFRFELVDVETGTKEHVEEEDDDSDDEGTHEKRITKRIKTTQSEDEPSTKGEFDPSDPANQSW